MPLENSKFKGVFGRLLESGSRHLKRVQAKLEVGMWNLKKFGC